MEKETSREPAVRLALFLAGALVGAGIAWLGSEDDPQPVRVATDAASGSPADDLSSAPAAIEQQAPETDAAPTEPSRRSSTTGSGVVDPRIGIVVFGAVTDEDGEPVSQAYFWFRHEADPVAEALRAETDGSGYSRPGLRPGRWQVTSTAQGFRPFERTLEVRDEPVQQFDLVLERSTQIEVRFTTSDGKPLKQALRDELQWYGADEVIAVAGQAPFVENLPRISVRSHWRYGIGRWESAGDRRRSNGDALPSEVSGILHLHAPLPQHVAAVYRHTVLDSRLVPAGTESLEFRLDVEDIVASLSTVTLRVLDAEDGTPVEGARVSLTDIQTGMGGTPTDSEGRVRLTNRPIGILELRIQKQGCEWFHQWVKIDPGETDLGTVSLADAHPTRVRVLRVDGKPATDAQLNMQNLQRYSDGQSIGRMSGQVDGEGIATFHALGLGPHLIRAFRRGESFAATVIRPETLGEEPVVLQLEPIGRASFSSSMKLSRTRSHYLTLRDSQRTPIYGRNLYGSPAQIELSPGTYTWELHEEGRLLRSGEVTVRAGATSEEIALR